MLYVTNRTAGDVILIWLRLNPAVLFINRIICFWCSMERLIISSSMLLLEGLNTSGAFNFRVDCGDKYLISSLPKRFGRRGMFSQNVLCFFPIRTCSMVGM